MAPQFQDDQRTRNPPSKFINKARCGNPSTEGGERIEKISRLEGIRIKADERPNHPEAAPCSLKLAAALPFGLEAALIPGDASNSFFNRSTSSCTSQRYYTRAQGTGLNLEQHFAFEPFHVLDSDVEEIAGAAGWVEDLIWQSL